MKRIKAACICQTLHFQLKEDVAHDYAVQLVHEEFNHYKKSLEKRQEQSNKSLPTEDQPGRIYRKRHEIFWVTFSFCRFRSP